MITKEELALCRKIAKKYRKVVVKGSWWHHNEVKDYPAKIELVHGEGSAHIFNDINKHKHLHSRGFPLWQISDCLEFWRERGWFELSYSEVQGKQYWTISYRSEMVEKLIEGKTPLEVCLKAVLAIVEGK